MNSRLSSGRWLAALAIGSFLSVSASPTRPRDVHSLSSLDGRIRVSIQMPAPNSTDRPRWSATFRAKPLLADCRLGLQTADAGELLAGVRVVRAHSRSVDPRIPVRFGKSDHASDRFREAPFPPENPKPRRGDEGFRGYATAI